MAKPKKAAPEPERLKGSIERLVMEEAHIAAIKDPRAELEEPELAQTWICRWMRAVKKKYLPDLLECKVGVVFMPTLGKAGGRVVLGKAIKLSSLERLLSAESFDVVIKLDFRQWCEMSDLAREALFYHELCHIMAARDEAGELTGWGLRPHDIEEFADVLEKYGQWQPKLATVDKAIQLRLSFQSTTPVAPPEESPE